MQPSSDHRPPSATNQVVARYTLEIAELRRALADRDAEIERCRMGAAVLWRRIQSLAPEVARQRDLLQRMAQALGFTPEEIGDRFSTDGSQPLTLHPAVSDEDDEELVTF